MMGDAVGKILNHHQHWREAVERATQRGLYVGDPRSEAYERGYLDALTDVVDILARAHPDVYEARMSEMSAP